MLVNIENWVNIKEAGRDDGNIEMKQDEVWSTAARRTCVWLSYISAWAYNWLTYYEKGKNLIIQRKQPKKYTELSNLYCKIKLLICPLQHKVKHFLLCVVS